MRHSGAGVLDYTLASFASRRVPQNPGPRTLIIHVCHVFVLAHWLPEHFAKNGFLDILEIFQAGYGQY